MRFRIHFHIDRNPVTERRRARLTMFKNQSVVESVDDIVDQIYRSVGARRTLGALIRAVLRRRQILNETAGLSDRMRQDIGLDAPRREIIVYPIDILLPRL